MVVAQGIIYFEKLRLFMTFHGLPDAEVAHVEVLGHLGHPGHAVGQPSLHLGHEPHPKVFIHDLAVSKGSCQVSCHSFTSLLAFHRSSILQSLMILMALGPTWAWRKSVFLSLLVSSLVVDGFLIGARHLKANIHGKLFLFHTKISIFTEKSRHGASKCASRFAGAHCIFSRFCFYEELVWRLKFTRLLPNRTNPL